MVEKMTVKGEGITLDLLLWRRHGVRGRLLVEQTLELNPGLGALGPILPLGTVLILPDLPAQTSTAKTRISLFGAA